MLHSTRNVVQMMQIVAKNNGRLLRDLTLPERNALIACQLIIQCVAVNHAIVVGYFRMMISQAKYHVRIGVRNRGLTCETAVHICYSYGIAPNTEWKKTLGEQWRQHEAALPKLAQSNIDIISLECHNSRVPLELLALVRGKKVMVGAMTSPRSKSEPPKKLPLPCAKHCSSSMPINSIPAPT